MARLFPLRSETPSQEGQPRVVDLADEDADAVFGALSSTTAREIYTTLHDEPGTPSDVAEAIDSSIQNVRYHLEKLEDAGLVEVVDTWYSSRGNEMSVYATANGPLIVTSDQSKAAQLKEAISRFIGGIVALAGGSLLVQHAAGQFFAPEVQEAEVPPDGTVPAAADASADDEDDHLAADDDASDDEVAEAPEEADADAPEEDAGDAGDAGIFDADEDEVDEDESADDAAEESPAAEEAPDEPDVDQEAGEPTSYEVDVDDLPTGERDDATVTGSDPGENVTIVTDTSADALEVASTLPPGLLFFLGGLVVLTAVTLYWYWSTPRLA
ncbi:ArsR/SmtB family transcription factor [Natronobeatus ordinarius]|uniref:ArsR/SmtB family transcription factor n=1 Tax=Natronobeatus ordinarius TaxID=2963433 RepID=UPI0020CB6AB3|nr:helix-turn-helix domain-containing protein [Natronobeatus ordinarius]